DVGVARDARGEWRTLEPGMVLTIEPGLYMPADAAVPLEYQGIGIRIEDDVVVTDAGCRVLSEEAPKDPDAIEALMTRPG
ncbi:MAG: M24 family metallopeptidase, partial [Chromatiaceae bacterium]|nr:M24 family metallopeptidase [Chromatiaceae bacterium]